MELGNLLTRRFNMHDASLRRTLVHSGSIQQFMMLHLLP